MSPRIRPAHRLGAAGLSLALATALSCSRPPEPLAFEYAGCSQVLRTGPTCLLDAGTGPTFPISIWLPLAPAGTTTEFRIDGKPVTAEGVPARDGLRYSIAVPRSARRLAMQREGTPLRQAAALLFAPLPAAPDWYTAAYQEALSGRPEAIEASRALLLAQLPQTAADPPLQARVLWVLARLPGAPEVLFRRTIVARKKAGHLLGEATAAAALAHRLVEDDRFAEAEKVLAAVAPPPGSPAEVLASLAYERGLLARLSGQPREALRRLAEAATEAERLGIAAYRAASEQQLALTLLGLGRFGDAEARFAALAEIETERATDEADRACAAAELATNRGWTRLLAREAGDDTGDPLPLLLAAREAYDRLAGCGARHQRGNARLNFALAHLQSGALDDAAADLAAARSLTATSTSAATATAEERLWQGEIEARLALARGRPKDALLRWQELEANARRSGSLEDLWLAATGRARAERALAKVGAALQALREAEDLLDRQAVSAQRSSRARWVAQREASARLRIELLLEQDRPAEALSAARRSRARVLRQIETEGRIERLSGPQRERWQEAVGAYRAARRKCDEDAAAEWSSAADRLPLVRSARASRCTNAEEDLESAVAALGLGDENPGAESFRPPAAGELLLAFHPLDNGWVAFAADASGVAVHRFDLPPSALANPEDLSARLLAPFGEAIRRARRVRLLPYGPLREIDLHALPFDAAPLLAGRPVVYGLDLLDRAPTPTVSTGTQPTALVIGDPRGDLSLSRKEAEAVERALRAGGWQVDTMHGEAATVDALLEALPRLALFHFAGHGVAGSADGGGELLLGREQRLLATEILNLRNAPARIVLSGCETGLADPGAAVEGLGLAQAFLLRGATQVVAAIRPVPDRETEALFQAFYQPPPHGDSDLDLAVRLARVQAAALRRDAQSAAASFRVFEP